MLARILILGALLSAPPGRQWTRFETLALIRDKRIDESSGVCASRLDPDRYFTHNDSGDRARFFKFDRRGDVTCTYDVVGVPPAVDWEDIASATIGGISYVYCGDIGDNGAVRKRIQVYRIPEPTPSPVATLKVRPDRIYTLTYPDGPHNAETLMVRPRTGDLYVVTKSSIRPSLVFKLSSPGATGSYRLVKVGEVQIASESSPGRLVTGGDIAPDGAHVVLRTYMAAWEFDGPAKFDDWYLTKPRRIQTNLEFGGEGIGYSLDGKSMITTSEGVPCQVSESRLVH